MAEISHHDEERARRMRAADVKPASAAMSPVAVDPRTRLIDALNLMRSRVIHHLIVMEGTQVVGVVSDRNIFQSGMTANSIVLNPIMTVKDVMVRMPEGLPADADLSTAITMMRRYEATALPIVQGERLIGIITESDLLHMMESWVMRTHSMRREKGEQEAQQLYTESEVFMANPLVQNIMHLLAQAGI